MNSREIRLIVAFEERRTFKAYTYIKDNNEVEISIT